MAMLRPVHPSKNLRRATRARDCDITITLHTGRIDPKPVKTGRTSGRMAAMNRASQSIPQRLKE